MTDETDIRNRFAELSGALAERLGKPDYYAQSVVASILNQLIDDAHRHQRIRPAAERRASARIAREIAYARRGRYRNHPQRRRR